MNFFNGFRDGFRIPFCKGVKISSNKPANNIAPTVDNPDLVPIDTMNVSPIKKEPPIMTVTSSFSGLKTDFDKIEELFELYFKTAPKWFQVAETDLSFAAASINTIVSKLGNAVDAEVSKVILAIQNDLVLAVKFIQSEDSSLNLIDVLNSLIDNLNGLLTLAAVKSSAVINEITAYVVGIVGELHAILNALPAK